MITKRSNALEDLIGAKLQKIEIEDNEFILRFNNGRCLTMKLKIHVGESQIVPEAELFCGYNHGVANCEHEWGTDAQHSNEYCKKCFVDKPE